MIAILCCVLDSRGNQHEALLKSAEQNCPGADVHIYRDHQELPTVERYNLAYKSIRHPRYSHYMFGASDIEISTPNFDTLITGITDQMAYRLNHRCMVLYPDDGVHGSNLCTHPIFTKEFLEATGEFFPTGYMRHCFVDNYIQHITSKTGTLIYCPTARIIHNHPIATNNARGTMDVHYERVYETSFMEEDRRRFDRCMLEHASSIMLAIEAQKKQPVYPCYTYPELKKLRRIEKRLRQLKKIAPWLSEWLNNSLTKA